MKERTLEWVMKRANEKNVIVTEDTDLFASGVLDSFGIIKLIAYMIETLGINLKQEDMIPANFRCINSICRLIERYNS